MAISTFPDEICVKIDDIIRTHKDDTDFLRDFALVLLAKSVSIQEIVENPDFKRQIFVDDFRVPKGVPI